jgi:hypothetical protein
MIITELYPGQGLGNQLWVYAASRSIAEHLNLPFVLFGAEHFKGKGFLDILHRTGISEDKASAMVMGRRWQCFHEELFYDPELNYISSDFDSRVLTLRGSHKLDGLFQSEEYFFGDMDRPKKYFILESSLKSKNRVPEDTCVINLRGGEYKRHRNFILPQSYWEQAIENMKRMSNVNNFLIVTDDKQYARAMFPGVEVLDGEIGDCYATIYNAKFLILSNSSFAYFPVKTGGNSRLVIAPKYWARYANVHKRWASPANLYQSWLWQSTGGQLFTYEECHSECQQTVVYYHANYFVRTALGQVQKPGIRRLIPASFRKKAKQVLSLILPKYFG